MIAKLINKQGICKVAPVGFSWTTLFFFFFVPLYRKDWFHFLLFFLIFALAFVFHFIMGQFIDFDQIQNLVWQDVSYGILLLPNLIFAFLYNKLYIKKLIIGQGFQAFDNDSSFLINAFNFKLPADLVLQYNNSPDGIATQNPDNYDTGQGDETLQELYGKLENLENELRNNTTQQELERTLNEMAGKLKHMDLGLPDIDKK